MPSRPLSITKAAAYLGVHTDTLRGWADEGKIPTTLTVGGHRRFRVVDLDALVGNAIAATESRVVIYCRVSSHDQKKSGDLERQVGRVSTHCAEKGYKVVEVLQEVGSGMSETRPKLNKLFKMVFAKQIDRVVVEHKDRLARFGFLTLQAFFASYGCTVEWTHEVLGKSYEEELVQDILTLMSSFSARIYGRRSALRKKADKAAAGHAK